MLHLSIPIIRINVALAAMTFSLSASAQPPVPRRVDQQQLRQQQQQQAQLTQRMQQQLREVAENPGELTDDPQLMSLHKEFIVKAEKLALEYERKKQFDKAREVYGSLGRLVPNYSSAEEGLGRILGNQAMQDRQLATVQANQGWQDSGAKLIQGMPIHIEIKGTWKVVYETGPEGIEIPEELRPRDNRIKLGTLIAAIANSPSELDQAKPFVLDQGNDFIAQDTGRLYLRMFDVEPSDNEGKLLVLIQSTFQK